MSQINHFADVILPFPLQQLYTYSIPDNLQSGIKIGIRAIVQFGSKKNYTAIIADLHSKKPEGFDTKEIISLLDDKPVVNKLQIDFWKWIAEYYICSLGEVMKAALPSRLKLESETFVLFNNLFENYKNLNDSEYIILGLIQKRKSLRLKEISGLKFKKNLHSIIDSLYNKGAIYLEESLKPGFMPKKESYLRLTEKARDEKFLTQYIEKNKRAKKQLKILFEYIALSGVFENKIVKDVKKKVVLKNTKANASLLQSLIKKEILETYMLDESRLKENYISKKDLPVLSAFQDKALKDIQSAFHSIDTVLLHGVASSGKTEIYFHLIEEVINEGKQVLYLLPEIALTVQIINRLKAHFGSSVGVYHSKFSDNEKVEIWNRLNNEGEEAYRIILGVRSSVFLPFRNLGLIIVDEEHEINFKQFDPSPRYNARDSAALLARLHKAKILFGTATPSLESYYNAESGKYKLIELKERYKEIPFPEIKIVNLKVAKKKDHMRSYFSTELLEKIGDCLNHSRQIILFQNRRGFSTFLMCAECGWIPHCRNCDVTLTYHKHFNLLVCHYCGYTQNIPSKCLKCETGKLQTFGFGTEKIEEELAIYFPSASISRLDLDSTRTKHSHEKIIYEFENKKTDILVGTQMITKGLDFSNVGLVGILNADLMFNFPDFRAFERSYQLIVQAGGRAGRQNDRGLVIIQTYSPEHPIIRNIIKNDYTGMYKTQLEERVLFKYPPIYRLIKITVKHYKAEICINAANILAKELRILLGDSILGPDIPLIARIKNMHLRDILIKIKRDAATSRLKNKISEIIRNLHKEIKSVTISIDVDPM